MKDSNVKLVLINTGRSSDRDTVPMGMIYIAGYLKKYGCITNIELLDLNFDDIYIEIQKINPDIIGIFAMTIDYSKTIEIAINIKKFKEIPILIGGPHISTLPTSLHESIDIGIIGEGEETMLELVNIYKDYSGFPNDKLRDVKGIVFRDENKMLIINKNRDLIIPLDRIPPLDKTLIHKNYLKKRILPNGEYGILAPLLTSKGCPYHCLFCSTSVLGRNKFRFNSPERIVDEIKDYVKGYGVSYIIIWDDLFVVSKERIRELVRVFKKERINLNDEEKKKVSRENRIDIPFSCMVRINLVDDELCELLKELGVKKVGFGFESGSDKYLRYLKGEAVTVDQARNAIKICKQHGFLISGSLIFGGPNETIGDMKKTLEFIDFLVEQDVENVFSYIMVPFPGTKMWEIAKERGKVNDVIMDWESLSYQNVDNTLLLDDSIDRMEFKKIFWEGRRKQKYFKWKKIKHELKHHPFQLIKNSILKPYLGISLFKKEWKEGEERYFIKTS